jgi:hypothetical protein
MVYWFSIIMLTMEADNKFKQAIEQSRGQTLSFYGVNPHFQNGVVERRIREL